MEEARSCCWQLLTVFWIEGRWRVKPSHDSIHEKGQLRSHLHQSSRPFSSLTTAFWASLGFAGHWQYLATWLPTTQWLFKFKQWTSRLWWLIFPEPTTSAYAGESGLPTWMDSLGEKKENEKKKEKTPNRLYFKNNRKAISCDNLLTLDQVYTGKRLKCNRFSGVRVLSSNS